MQPASINVRGNKNKVIVAPDSLINATDSAFDFNGANVTVTPDPKSITVKNLTLIPSADQNIVGRTAEIGQIMTQLEKGNKPLVLRGMGGLGKTTIAKVILNEQEADSEHVAWIDANNGLVNGFTMNNFLLNLKIIDGSEFVTDEHSKPELFKAVITLLSNLAGPNLLIIDGLKQEEDLDFIRALTSLSKNWRVMVTSRFLFEDLDDFPLGFLSPADCMLLFYKHYSGAKNDSELDKILSRVGYHTLATELLAKTAQKLRLSIPDLYDRLNKKGLAVSSSTDVKVSHSARSVDNIQAYIIGIFSIGDISKMEEYLLKNISVLNSYNYSDLIFRYTLFTKDEQADEAIMDSYVISITNLYEKGWLMNSDAVEEKEASDLLSENGSDEEDEVYYKMHSLIQEVIRLQLKPSVNDCKIMMKFFSRLPLANLNNDLMVKMWLAKEQILSNLEGNEKELFDLAISLAEDLIALGLINDSKRYTQFASDIIKERQKMGLEITAEWHLILAEVFSASQDAENAVTAAEKSIDMERQTGDLGFSLSEVLLSASSIFLSAGNFDKAFQAASEALKIREQIYPAGNISLAEAYNMFGDIKRDEENVINEETMNYYVKAFTITKKFAEPESVQLGTATLRMAHIATADESFYDLAGQLIWDALQIYYKKLTDTDSIFLIESAAAEIYRSINDTDNAAKYYRSGIERKEKEEQTSGLSFIRVLARYSLYSLEILKNPQQAKENIDKACQYLDALIDLDEYAFVRKAKETIYEGLLLGTGTIRNEESTQHI